MFDVVLFVDIFLSSSELFRYDFSLVMKWLRFIEIVITDYNYDKCEGIRIKMYAEKHEYQTIRLPACLHIYCAQELFEELC